MDALRQPFLCALIFLGLAGQARAVNDPEPREEPPHRRVVVIDPGHGGRDLGAVSRKVAEKGLDMEIARRLREEVSRWPEFSAQLTHDGDEFLPLSERVERARKAEGSAFLSIHADKTSGRGKEGVVLYYFGKNRTIPKGPRRLYGEMPLPPPPQAQVAASQRLARCILEALRAEGIQAGEINRGGFAVLKNPDMPSVLLEVGNLRNRSEAKQVSDARFQQRLARAIARGLKHFFAESAKR